MLLSMTACAQTTYLDSLNRSFDNCVFLHDSLSKEVSYLKELISVETQLTNENTTYINILETQITELNTQKANLSTIIDKANKDYDGLINQSKIDKRKAKSKGILIGLVSFSGGAGVGAILTAVFLLK